jgi:hypothetical protein
MSEPQPIPATPQNILGIVCRRFAITRETR